MENYTKLANEFAKKHNVKLIVMGKPEYKRYFSDDKDSRYVFKMKLTRNGKSYTFTFGQSIAAGAEEPTMYDILACMTKYDPEDFENFCANYGYDTDSRSAERIYKNVCKEWEAMQRLFPEPEVLEEMNEIN
jgi:hypothetical protein